jgi:hypothetical protein
MERVRWIDHLSYDEAAYILSIVDERANNVLTDDSWERLIVLLDSIVQAHDDLDETMAMLQIGTFRHEWDDIHGQH